MDHRTLSVSLFVIAYIFFVFLPARRTAVAVMASLLVLLTGVMTLKQTLFAINWNVMGIFTGTLIVADIFMESRVPAWLAEVIVNRTKSASWAILLVCIFTGFISSFVENVATVMIMAPIALAIAKKLNFSPVKVIIGVAISSNLQGTATMIGDSPSMLLAGFAKMNFWDFFFYKGKPSIFFAVELGAVFAFAVLYLFFRKHTQKHAPVSQEKVKSWIPTILLVCMVLSLAMASFLRFGISWRAGAICISFGIVSIIFNKLANSSSIRQTFKSFDWNTAFFLMGIFILVGSLTVTGWIEIAADYLSKVVGNNIFFGYTLIVFVSVALSAFIDNIPFLAAMLPVTISLSTKLGVDPSLFLFGLLIGASLGGNITPIGASANVVGCGILKKEGYHVKFSDFVKMGLPFTLAAVGAAYIFLWFVWGVRK
jgi:Na+/H+ antiporter NhaD/arsenite permease-like protein